MGVHLLPKMKISGEFQPREKASSWVNTSMKKEREKNAILGGRSVPGRTGKLH